MNLISFPHLSDSPENPPFKDQRTYQYRFEGCRQFVLNQPQVEGGIRINTDSLCATDQPLIFLPP